jgi:hypothetical protein
MGHRQHLERLREQASALPPQAFLSATGSLATPAATEALKPLSRALSLTVAWCLAWALVAPSLTGDPRAALLSGLPGLCLGVLLYLARRPARRRVCLVLATACCAALALASAPVLGALQHLAEPHFPATLYQLACLLGALCPLLVAIPAWRNFNQRERSQKAWERLRAEL